MAYSPLELAHAFIKTGELDDALAALTQHLDDNPDDESRRLRAQVLMRLPGDDNLRAALTDLDTLSQHTIDDSIRRSIILERLGDWQQAVQVMRHVCAQDERDERLAERLVQLLIMGEAWEEANHIVDAMPRTWRWLQWSGDIATYMGDSARAVLRYGLALAQIETRFDFTIDGWGRALKARLLLARGNAYVRQNHLDEAESDFDAAAELVPDDPMLLFYRAVIAALRDDVDEAVKLCNHALAHATDAIRTEMITTLKADTRLTSLVHQLHLDESV